MAKVSGKDIIDDGIPAIFTPAIFVIETSVGHRLIIAETSAEYSAGIEKINQSNWVQLTRILATIRCEHNWMAKFFTLLNNTIIGGAVIVRRGEPIFITSIAAEWLMIFARGYVGNDFVCKTISGQFSGGQFSDRQ